MLDRYWDIVDRNSATDLLLEGCAPTLLEPPVNALRLTLHPLGMAPRIRNLAQWRAHLLHQVAARADRTADPRLRGLLTELRSYAGADDGVGAPGGSYRAAHGDVVVPLRVLVGGKELSLVSMTTTTLTAGDVTIDELQIEAFYPADDATAAALR